MSPLLFLDVDGVLARLVIGYRYGTLTPECVQALNMLTNVTGAEIVVSSSWRYVEPFDKMVATLRAEGVTGKIIGGTPCPERPLQNYGLVAGCSRGEEIAAWLRVNGARPFVILDDSEQMGELEPFTVYTNPALGLTPIDAGQALWILDHQPTRRAAAPRIGSEP